MTFLIAAFFYLGPDQFMPIASSLAGIFAFLLLFYNKLIAGYKRLVSRFNRKSAVNGYTHPAAMNDGQTPAQGPRRQV